MGYLKNKYKEIVGKPLALWGKTDFSGDIDTIDVLNIEVVGHCNLNCKGCSVFSPLVKEESIDINDIKKDIEQLKIVFPRQIKKINIMGGEPLLFQNIIGFVRMVRNIFPNMDIDITTNGTLLLRQSDEFWKTLNETNTEIKITRYPVDVNYKGIKARAKEYGVKVTYFGRTKIMNRKLYRLPLDSKGRQNAWENYEGCFMARHCITMRDGKIFACSVAADMGRFNSYFEERIPIAKDDYGDIYKETAETILRKVSHATPICAYCDVKSREYGNKWETSKRHKTEWM